MKHIFIVNPISGKGKTLKAVDRIKKVCEEALETDAEFTDEIWITLENIYDSLWHLKALTKSMVGAFLFAPNSQIIIYY